MDRARARWSLDRRAAGRRCACARREGMPLRLVPSCALCYRLARHVRSRLWWGTHTACFEVRVLRPDLLRSRCCGILGRVWGARSWSGLRFRRPQPCGRGAAGRVYIRKSAPSRIRTCATAPECIPAYSRYQQERGLRCWHGAPMGRAKSSLRTPPTSIKEPGASWHVLNRPHRPARLPPEMPRIADSASCLRRLVSPRDGCGEMPVPPSWVPGESSRLSPYPGSRDFMHRHVLPYVVLIRPPSIT